MAKNDYHLIANVIPEGFQIYVDRLEVAGISFQKNDATAFAKSKNGWLELEREPDNKYDKNAIKIIGCSKGFFSTKRRFIGYVPKKVAKMIVEGNFCGKVIPRLSRVYIGEDGYVEVYFQILGPKGQKYEFEPSKPEEGEHYTAYVEYVKELKAEKRYDEAIEVLLKLIDEVEKEARKERWGVAPWYYEQLAIIYRKQKMFDDEVNILERYAKQPKAPGVGPGKLEERLIKAHQLRDKHK